jgi:uncharacterized protein
MAQGTRAPHKQHDQNGIRIPVRTCVACRARRPQAELLRIAKGEAGLTPDDARKLEGRGWYVCKDKLECMGLRGLGKFARGEAAKLVDALEFWRKNHSQESKPAYEINSVTQVVQG